jgi:hypothetical protein
LKLCLLRHCRQREVDLFSVERAIQLTLSQPDLREDIAKSEIVRRVGERAAKWRRQKLEVAERFIGG